MTRLLEVYNTAMHWVPLRSPEDISSAEQLGGGWAPMWADGVGDAMRRRQAWLTARREDFIAILR